MTAVAPATMDANKAMIIDFHQRLWGTGDHSAIDEYFLPDAVVHFSGFDGSAVQTVRDDASRWWGAFADTRTTIQDILADGDRVIVRWDTSGLHMGQYGKVEPTNKTINMTGIDIFRIADGQVVECWSMWDGLDVFDQMGVLPDLW
ncbi:ester cyclase [Microbacterium sp. NPDC076911]|uniref:ester cyclase n=1 Tax=Microbacterium sp. NPDC076911 TaxID=3154958 RepID=UPI0034219DD8